MATGEPGEGYQFHCAVVRWLTGEDALTGRIDSMSETARTLGRFVAELQSIDMTDAPRPGSEGFVRGLPLVGRDAYFRAALAQCQGLVDTQRVVLDFGAMATGDPAYDVTPAWHLFDRSSRHAFYEIVGADDATRRRARGLVVSGCVIALPYYLHSNPSMVATARRGSRRSCPTSSDRWRRPTVPGQTVASEGGGERPLAWPSCAPLVRNWPRRAARSVLGRTRPFRPSSPTRKGVGG